MRKMDPNWNKRTDTVKVNTLRKGTLFQSITGEKWIVERRAEHVTWVTSPDGLESTMFANCATVIPVY